MVQVLAHDEVQKKILVVDSTLANKICRFQLYIDSKTS